MATTVLLFVLAGMGLILLIMMVLSSGKSLLISQNFKDTEKPEDFENLEDPEDSGDSEKSEIFENSETPEHPEKSRKPENAENTRDFSDTETPYSYHNHYTADETDEPDGESVPRRPSADSDTQTETAKVIWKLDERERFLNENHLSTIRNEKYALIFRKEDGTEFRISCSKAAYSKTPYDVVGEVTFRNQKLIRFVSKQETVSDEYSIIAS